MAAGMTEGRKLSQSIADFIVGFDLKNAPPVVIERARVAFVDTVGSQAASCRPPTFFATSSSSKARRRRQPSSGAHCAHRPGSPRSPTASPATPWISTSPISLASRSRRLSRPFLPVAETTGGTPSEMLAAFIIAAEIAGRLNRAAPTVSRLGGWHATGTIGTIAAAAASARLMKIPVAKIPDIVGITVSMASGVTANFGTMTKPLHSGHAAHDGILAALLGARGFTSNASALEGKDGYFETFARGLKWSLAPFADLGKSYEISRSTATSSSLTRAADSATPRSTPRSNCRDAVKLEDIAHVDVTITKYAVRRYTDKYPQSAENAMFSGPYLAASRSRRADACRIHRRGVA
jgi:2-methylcitrate dehydratase PrpD